MIYIVKSSKGSYDDYGCWNEKAFNYREDAEKYAKELDVKHSNKPHFINDEFVALIEECENELPDWDDFTGDPSNRKEWLEWQDQQEKKQFELLSKLMYSKGQFFTQSMYDQYNEWVNNSFDEWHKCDVEELELV